MRKVDLHPKTDTFIMDLRKSSFFSVEKINAGYIVKIGDYASCIEILILIFNKTVNEKNPFSCPLANINTGGKLIGTSSPGLTPTHSSNRNKKESNP